MHFCSSRPPASLGLRQGQFRTSEGPPQVHPPWSVGSPWSDGRKGKLFLIRHVLAIFRFYAFFVRCYFVANAEVYAKAGFATASLVYLTYPGITP